MYGGTLSVVHRRQVVFNNDDTSMMEAEVQKIYADILLVELLQVVCSLVLARQGISNVPQFKSAKSTYHVTLEAGRFSLLLLPLGVRGFLFFRRHDSGGLRCSGLANGQIRSKGQKPGIISIHS